MTVVTVGMVVIAAILAATVAIAGGVAASRTRAQGAADASALAAAFDARDRRALGFAYRGPNAPPCRVADEVARRWGAILRSCGVGPGGVVSVEVTMPTSVGEARATARAGPRCSSP